MFTQLRILTAQIRANYNAIEQDNEQLRKAYDKLQKEYASLQEKYNKLQNDECERNSEKTSQEIPSA